MKDNYMKHDTNNLAMMSSKKINLATIKKFVKNNIILARMNSYFTDHKRPDIVVRSTEFLNVTFDKERNEILNSNGFGFFELTNYVTNNYEIYEDEKFIGYSIYNCVADITVVTLKN